ncbi:hypothetical protein AL346_04760 [Chelatococcus sp. CO-6]|nr:hypothetical protein AL346_04760 [Chelatococcus sp. CO-6]
MMDEIYCGPAPTPATLPASWNIDAPAAVLCLLLIALYAVRGERDRRAAFVPAVLLVAALFMSPLCALTAALFSARAVHHVLLVAVAAPLLAASFPTRRRGGRPRGLALLVALHGLVFWAWHAPALYDAAIRSPVLYWPMQLSLLGTGVLLWRAVLRDTRTGAALLALLATVVQMGFLGALLTFAREPLYQAHFLTTAAFGLDPRQDQQLAGLVMWVPAALPYLAAALYLAFVRLGAGTAEPRAG